MKPFIYSPKPAILFYHQQGMPSEMARYLNSNSKYEVSNNNLLKNNQNSNV
jgi:hypothetical protein